MRLALLLVLFSLGMELALATELPAQAPQARLSQVFVDDLGRRISLPYPVRRIVSLAPSVTEILFAVGAGGKIVGDTNYCDYPPEALKIPRVGGEIDPNTEKIVALQPDVVIVSDETISPADASQLAARYHAPVYVTAARSYADVVRNVRKLGAMTGDVRRTASAVRKMLSALSLVQKAVNGRTRPSVFVVIWEKPLMTASGRSFIGDLIRLAGGVNIAEGESLPYPEYPEEKLVKADPDMILAQDDGDKAHHIAPISTLIPLNLRAIHSGYVYSAPEAWTSRPGPRLALGLSAIAHILHPEAFRASGH